MKREKKENTDKGKHEESTEELKNDKNGKNTPKAAKTTTKDMKNKSKPQETKGTGSSNKADESSKSQQKTMTVYICDKCDFETSGMKDIKSHESNNHKQVKKYKCEDCSYESNERDHLREHKTSKHRNNQKEEKIDKVECKECDFTADSNETMKKHMEIAMGHKRKIKCKYYLNNRCRFGKFCRFQHSNTNDTAKPRGQCQQFDKCSKFPYCGLEHKEMCRFQEYCQNYECKFVHLSEPFLGWWKKAPKRQ